MESSHVDYSIIHLIRTMSIWNSYPSTYRKQEVEHVLRAIRSGECAAVIGLSGAGKSNFVGFIHHRSDVFPHPNRLIDCNRLLDPTPEGFFNLFRQTLEDVPLDNRDPFSALERSIGRSMAGNGGKLAIIIDRFDSLADDPVITNGLRALRDAYKFQLTYVISTRYPLDEETELAELFFGNTTWLGPMSESDTQWNVDRYAKRLNVSWQENVWQQIYRLTGGYPSLVKAVCEAFANGTPLKYEQLRDHPAVTKRITEFSRDNPSVDVLRQSKLTDIPLLQLQVSTSPAFDTTQLTEKEYLLLEFVQSHPGEVCSKDDLIRAVWPEDMIYEQGVRDDSLAQLVRRLRVKIEVDPSEPKIIITIPGRGYLYSKTSSWP